MDNNLDQFFQKKLSNRKFSPMEGDWAAMENLLNSKGTPPPSSLSINWLITALFLVIVGAIIYAGINGKVDLQKEQLSDHSQIENDQNKGDLNTQNNTEIRTTKNKLNSESKSFDSEFSSLTKKDEKNKIELSKEDNLISHSNENSTALSKNLKGHQIPVKESNLEIEFESNVSEIRPNNMIERENEISFVNMAPSFLKEAKEKTNSGKNNQNDLESDESSLFVSTTTTKNSRYDIGNYFNESKSIKPSMYLHSSSIKSFEDILGSRSIVTIPKQGEATFKIKPIKPKRSLPIQLSIAAFGEVSYITKKIKGDNEFASLISIRNSQEKNIVSGGVGVELQASFKCFGLSSGITLNQWGENIQYEEKYASTWELSTTEINDTLWTQDIIFTYDSIINPIDSATYIVYVVDSSFVTVVDSILINTIYDSTEVYNAIGLSVQNGRTSVQYWEIPLYFSYQFDVGDFYLRPGIGVTIGFLKITKGYYMAEDLTSLIALNTNYAVFKKTLVNGVLNFGVGYRLGDRFSIEATPCFRFNLSTIFEDPGLIQRYSSLSLQFKLRYYF